MLDSMVTPPMARSPSEIFWPPKASYHVAFLELYPTNLPDELGLDRGDLMQVVFLSNAIHRLQRLDGEFVDEPMARELLGRVHKLLVQSGSNLSSPGASRIMHLAANNLIGESRPLVDLSQVYAEESGLILACGPLATWDWKSPAPLHSVLVGREDRELTRRFCDMDTRVDEVAKFLGQQIGVERLWPTNNPRIVAAELLMCGGEANTYPKQFAYFFSDTTEKLGSQQGDVVVLFPNVYSERFKRLSLPLFEEFSGPLSVARRQAILDPMWLLTWFKGHDVGHFLSYDAQRSTLLPEEGDDDGAVLHEVMADAFGFLALLGPWDFAEAPDAETAVTVFLSEMLRYMRRGVAYFPDSKAAFFEFLFLERNGYLSLDRDAQYLQWNADAVIEGLSVLAQRISKALLLDDGAEREELLAVYGPDAQADQLDELLYVFRNTEHLPDDLGYRMVEA